VQRYECTACGKKFRAQRNRTRIAKTLWRAYTERKQTLTELGTQYGRSHAWVRSHLDAHVVTVPRTTPEPTVVVADTTFWGRSYGVCVFRAWTLKKNIWWGEVESEKVAHYHYARKMLEDRGWKFTAAVVDGRRGLATVFKDIPVQICQFHQIQRVTKYLTRRPQTDAGKALRTLALILTKTDEKTFTDALMAYEGQWKSFLNEKTIVLGLQRPQYTHKNVRSAFFSLKRNLPYLFTYLRYRELNIPHTTNTIDGSFASVKKKTAAHHGLRRDRRFKVISELLRGDEK
jgi:hypothetical protein